MQGPTPRKSFLGKVPLSVLLIVPFVAELVIIVGLVGYLSYMNGRASVNDMAAQISSEISSRIEENLHGFLSAPLLMNQQNQIAIQEGWLDIGSLPSWRGQFWRQARSSETITNIAAGNEKGEYIGIDKLASGQIVAQESNASTQFNLNTSAVDENGKPINVLSVTENYDPRVRPWYSLPAGSGVPRWSNIYKHIVDPTLQVALGTPLYDKEGKIEGVITAAVRLSKVASFLANLKIGKTGKTFIVETSGLLVATSAPEKPFVELANGTIQRVNATQSNDRLIRETASFLLQHFETLDTLASRQQLNFISDKKLQYVQVAPFQNTYGLDWRIVVVVPEADFMAGIDSNRNKTIALCILALLLTVSFGFLTARWIIKPINQLSRATKALAEGKDFGVLPTDRGDEIGELALSFEEMSSKLRASVESLRLEIKERTRVENELKDSENQYRELFDNASDAIVILGPSGSILKVNQAFCDRLGYSREELMHMKILDIDTPEFAALMPERMEVLLRTGRNFFETVHIRKDGTTMPVEVNCKIIDFAGDKAILSIDRDISERKRVEAALIKSDERMRLFFERQIVGMAITSPAMGWIQVNDKLCRMLDYSAEDLYKRTWVELTHPDDLAQDEVQFKRLLAGEIDEYSIEKRFIRKDGFPVYTNLFIVCVRFPDGSVDYVLAVLEDITDRKRAEEEKIQLQAQFQQAQKMESVGRLAGGVAHDFNNMLSAILGHTELALIKTSPSEPLHESLKIIEMAALRSADLVRQLLAFARKQIVEPKVMDVNNTVAGMLKMLQRLIREEIDFAWGPKANLWHVRIDPSQLDQLLANLCVNARDAIDGVGKITIETKNSTFDDDYCNLHPGYTCGEYVMLAVSDSGCGMDKEVMDHLFEPFYTTKEVGKGTGLGLATVYGIVKQNNGFINVYSEPGQGTTFKIYLPRFNEKTVEPVSAATEDIPKGNGETLLLVEDEVHLLKMNQEMLELLGYKVIPASVPSEALSHAKKSIAEIQLLITDVVMPEMNGRELEKLIKKIKPGLKCLFMSGYTADVIAHRGVLDEDINFLQKPFSLRELAIKVREALGEK